jgi:LCP family protein required for cell wall assembly
MSDGSPTPDRAGHQHVRRAFLAVSATVAALVMVASAVAMGAYRWTSSEIRTIPPAPSADDGPGGEQEPVDIAGRCDTRACNYLLLGSDSRQGLTPEEQEHFGTNEDIGGENRSDTIILVHTDPRQERAVFVSFPRDLWVQIPNVGMGKINSAFSGGIDRGGAQLVARTVKSLTGMQIHHVMYVSLAGFEGLVDALGGVDMCVPYAMFDEKTGLDIDAGCQRFDGFTALAYVRTRNQPCDRIPDFARIGRQQQFLRAVISTLLQPGELLRLPDLVPELLGNIVVDEGLNPAELVYLAGQLQDVGTEDADFRTVPSIPAGIYDANGTFLSIVRPIEPDASELFRRLREGRSLGDLGTELAQTAPSPANIVVSVVDKRAGDVAADVLGVLTDGGFNTSPGILGPDIVAPPTNGSMILYRDGAEAMAKVVGTYFPNMELVPAPPGALPAGQDVAVVVTSGYEIPEPQEGAQQVECPA